MYPKIVMEMNRRLSADLGQSPQYAWIWSEDLLHVMELIDPDTGKPLYVEDRSPAGLIIMVPKTAVRKLLPTHEQQWILCALVEVNSRDGLVHGTGNGNWVPVSSSASGPVCLPRGEEPGITVTQGAIDSIRQFKSRKYADHESEWLADKAKREKAHWTTIYDIIRDAGTAFYNAPGKRGHVSFPSPQIGLSNGEYSNSKLERIHDNGTGTN